MWVLSYWLLGPFMGPSIMAWFWLWIPVGLWFALQPEDFLDEDGKVLHGFPTLVARTRDLLAMLFFNTAPFLANTGPDAVELTLEGYDFILGFFIIIAYWIIAGGTDSATGGFLFMA